MKNQTYEIHDLTTKELLADNLEFDDMPELLGAYQEFYPDHEIVACCRNCSKHSDYITNAQTKAQQRKAFREQWFALLTENACNIY